MSECHPLHGRQIWVVERQRECCQEWEPVAFRKKRSYANSTAAWLKHRYGEDRVRIVLYKPSPPPPTEVDWNAGFVSIPLNCTVENGVLRCSPQGSGKHD